MTGLAAVQGRVRDRAGTPLRGDGLQVERTPVDAADQPTGRRRSSASGSRAHRDAQRPDVRRVRLRSRRAFLLASERGSDDGAAVLGAGGTTNPQWGVGPGASLRTPFEETNGATYTNDVNEYFYTGALDAASERMRVVEIGRTLLGRPINMFIFGYPGPLPSAEQISESPTTLIQCHVHGNEPSRVVPDPRARARVHR